MSEPAVTVTPEGSLEDCCQRMEENQLRRLPVVDATGACCGMVSQADIARHAPEHELAEVVRDVSRPTREPSRPGCC
jgi:CBS-domain-containing membrane protein